MQSDRNNLIEEQRRIEEEATLTGIRRAAKALARAQEKEREATSRVGAAMVHRIVRPVMELLAEDNEQRGRGRATAGGPLLRELREIEPEVICLAASRAALQRMSRPTKLIALARTIGDALEDELRWHRWEKLDKGQALAVRRRVAESQSPRQRHAALAGFARRWEKRALAEAWSSGQLIGLGTRFVHYLVKLGVFEMTRIEIRVPGKKMKAAHAVQLTKQAAEWAKEMGDFLAVSRPLSWPMVIPPKPWTEPFGGGFHFREGLDHPLIPRPLKPLPLVRRACKEQRRMLSEAHERGDLGTVYGGLNAVQGTAWRINQRVYGVLTKLLEEGKAAPGITPLDPAPIPERMSEEEVKADKKKFIAHKNRIRLIKKGNAAMFSKRMSEHRIYAAAKKFVTYKEIYFAHNLDSRGRAYACSDDLSPQGNDLQRGLLEFAQGDKLDKEGLKWLAVHLANCWGFDKASFDDRVKWAAEHHEMIMRIAEDPLENREWMDADKKSAWQFLAACFAWKDAFDSDSYFDVVCRVPVMLDGSCSGIQHYAALLRDADVGREVNLVPADKPGDLYAVVAEEAMSIMRRRRGRVSYAGEWYYWKPDRKITKRATMTLPYGVSFLSALDYIREGARERYEKEGVPRWLDTENKETDKDAHVALAKFIWEAIHVVAKRPLEGMTYVKRLVNSWADWCGHRKFHWTSPVGFPVVTNYLLRKVRSADVVAPIGDKTVTLSYGDEIDVTNWSRVATAAPPNFVHSLDASHLLMSLKRAHDEGIAQLAAVHDAFGTTPTKTARFAQILREEFAKLYQNDPFECLRATLRKYGAPLPEAPVMGSLQVADIARAEYLFA